MSIPIPQTWRIDDFSGGEWDGFVKGPQGGFRYGENVEVLSYDGWLKLSNEGTEVFDYTGDLLAISPFPSISSPSSIAYSTLNWSISRIFVDTDVATEVLAWGPAIQNKIMGFFSEYNTWLGYTAPYGISDLYLWVGKIHRFAQDYSSTVYGVGTFTLPNGRTSGTVYKPSIVTDTGWQVVFGYCNWIWEVNQWVPTLKVSLPSNVDVVWISLYQDTYRVYYNTNDLNPDVSSYVAYWDWVSEDLTQSTKYENSRITAVYANGQYDYIVVNGRDLYSVGGLVRSIVRSSTIGSSVNSRFLYANWTVNEGNLIIPSQLKNGSVWLYEFGDFYVGSKKSLFPSLWGITANWVVMRSGNRYVFRNNVTWSIGKVYSYPYSFDSNSVSTGYVTTYPIEWGVWRYSKKKLESVRVSYVPRGSGFSIKVYARKNSTPETSVNTGWTLLKTFDDNSLQWGLISTQEVASTWFDFFNSLEFKFELNKSTATNLSPIICSVEADFVDNISD